MFTCVFILHQLNPLLGKKLGFFSSPFPISISRFLILAKTFRNDLVAACSTAPRSATEKIEMGVYLTVLCLSKMTQRNNTADWLKFQ